MKPRSVLFVCLGNICRSPTAEAIFRKLLTEHQKQEDFSVDSAGTGDWHIGKPPHGPAVRAAAARGIDMSTLRARQVAAADFKSFDYILAMDHLNLSDLRTMQPKDYKGHLGILTDFDGEFQGKVIADPYGGTPADFDRAFEHIDRVTRAFFKAVVERS